MACGGRGAWLSWMLLAACGQSAPPPALQTGDDRGLLDAATATASSDAALGGAKRGDGGRMGILGSEEPAGPGTGSGSLTAGSPGSSTFDPALTYVVNPAGPLGQASVVEPRVNKLGRVALPALRGAWVLSTGALVYQRAEPDRNDSLLEFTCDPPCEITGAAVSWPKDLTANDSVIFELPCQQASVLISADDHVYYTCGAAWQSDDAAATAVSDVGELLSVHANHKALVRVGMGADAGLGVADLLTGEIAHVAAQGRDLASIVAARVTTTTDGFWLTLPTSRPLSDAERFRVSFTGELAYEGFYPAVPPKDSSYEFGPGRVAHDGSMYRVVPYVGADGVFGTAVVHTMLGVVASMGVNVEIDTAFHTWFSSKMQLAMAP